MNYLHTSIKPSLITSYRSCTASVDHSNLLLVSQEQYLQAMLYRRPKGKCYLRLILNLFYWVLLVLMGTYLQTLACSFRASLILSNWTHFQNLSDSSPFSTDKSRADSWKRGSYIAGSCLMALLPQTHATSLPVLK